jgi:hypothetical protein
VTGNNGVEPDAATESVPPLNLTYDEVRLALLFVQNAAQAGVKTEIDESGAEAVGSLEKKLQRAKWRAEGHNV